MVRGSDSGAGGRGFDPHSGRRVVSLNKTHLLPNSTGNTQEAVAPSQHDRNIVNRDVKNQLNQTTTKPEDQWSNNRSPDNWAYFKYKNKFRQSFV